MVISCDQWRLVVTRCTSQWLLIAISGGGPTKGHQLPLFLFRATPLDLPGPPMWHWLSQGHLIFQCPIGFPRATNGPLYFPGPPRCHWISQGRLLFQGHQCANGFPRATKAPVNFPGGSMLCHWISQGHWISRATNIEFPRATQSHLIPQGLQGPPIATNNDHS
jgi:hypothetical protein